MLILVCDCPEHGLVCVFVCVCRLLWGSVARTRYFIFDNVRNRRCAHEALKILMRKSMLYRQQPFWLTSIRRVYKHTRTHTRAPHRKYSVQFRSQYFESTICYSEWRLKNHVRKSIFWLFAFGDRSMFCAFLGIFCFFFLTVIAQMTTNACILECATQNSGRGEKQRILVFNLLTNPVHR